jgi:DNA-binding transcriptional ArsR family regulator
MFVLFLVHVAVLPVSRRPSLDETRSEILLELGHEEWVTPSELTDWLGLGHGIDWLRVALVLERLANDGLVELERPGSRVRRFRRRRA